MIDTPTLNVSRSYERDSAFLTWEKDPAVVTYEVYQQAGLNNLHMEKIIELTAADFVGTVFYLSRNLEENTIYSFKIRAVADEDLSNFSEIATDF